MEAVKDYMQRKKLGLTYSAVMTDDDTTSGAIVSGTVNASNMASQLLATTTVNRACAISIANASGYKLSSPEMYVFSGNLSKLPVSIDHGFTGLVCAQRNTFSTRGTAGVITYEIEGLSTPVQFQLMWSVPFDFNLFDSWVNVAIGERTACNTLFRDMYRGRHGDVIRSRETTRVSRLADNVRAEVVMTDGGRCTLVIRFFREA